MEGVVMATMGLNIKHYIALLLLSLATTMTMAQTETTVAQWQRQACELRLPAKFATLPWALTNCDATFHTTHAEGAWALSASAAMRYGLRVDGTTDERRDVQKGARAALSYLADLAQLVAVVVDQEEPFRLTRRRVVVPDLHLVAFAEVDDVRLLRHVDRVGVDRVVVLDADRPRRPRLGCGLLIR